MQKKRNLEAAELLHTQNNVSATHNENSNLIERKQIPGTLFQAIKDETGWFITISKYALTERYDTIERAMEEMEKNKWSVITIAIIAIIESKEILITKDDEIIERIQK